MAVVCDSTLSMPWSWQIKVPYGSDLLQLLQTSTVITPW